MIYSFLMPCERTHVGLKPLVRDLLHKRAGM
nr:MAG TPA: hypothetical protein [Caudoviricetes sp.]DAN39025.1 MAG TPA: hypothetical protein [Caudoviricetes sp.]DAV43816.1 MAG TPA: hypothetical protein [Caudoviricetes sp.]